MGAATGAIIAAQIRKEKELAAYLRERGALSATTAADLRLKKGYHQAKVKRVVRRGAFMQTDDGLHWLDEAGFSAMLSRRRRTILWTMVGVFLAMAISVMTIYLLTGAG